MVFPRAWLCRLAVGALCLAFFLQIFFSSRVKSPSNDESLHIMAGASYISTHTIAINPQHPPLLKELAGIAMALGGMHWHNPQNIPIENLPGGWEWPTANKFVAAFGAARTLAWARFPLMLLTPLTGLLVFLWGRELAGDIAGLGAAFLFAADPNMLAHSYLVTTDAGVTTLSLLYLFCLYRYLQKPSMARAAFAGVTLGLALCAKFSAVFLLPMSAVLLAAWWWWRPESRQRGSLLSAPFVKQMAVLAVGAVAVIQICYFSVSGPFLYLEGLGKVNADHRPDFIAYLDGQEQHRFLTYFAAAWLVKEPLATVGLALGGIFLAFRNRTLPLLAKLFFLLPPLVYFLACTIWAENIGIRYLMPAMPYGFIAGGMALAALLRGPKMAKGAAALACAWVAMAAIGIYPDHLSYFNEAACLPEHANRIGLDGGSRCASEWLADSNVDWGQSLPQLKEWLDRNVPGQTIWLKYFGTYPPENYGITQYRELQPNLPPGPPPGIYVVSAHQVAYWGLNYVFSWMRGDPDAVVAHTYSVFRMDRHH